MRTQRRPKRRRRIRFLYAVSDNLEAFGMDDAVLARHASLTAVGAIYGLSGAAKRILFAGFFGIAVLARCPPALMQAHVIAE